MILTLRYRIGIIMINKTFLNNYSTSRESRILKAMISKQNKYNFEKNVKLKVNHGPLNSYVIEGKPNSKFKKNSDILNTFYAKNVMEAVETSQSGIKLLELGVHISKVKMFKESGTLDVYWYKDPSKPDDENLNKILTETALELKDEFGLSNKARRPLKVRFVRDLYSEKSINVQEIFEKPEFKKDLKIADAFCNLNLNIAAEIDKVIPEMKHDVYDLNHDQYMENILKQKKKNKRTQGSEIIENKITSDWPIINFDKFAYEKFYRKNEALRAKKLRMNQDLIYNPADDMEIEEREVEWNYGEHGEVNIDFEKERENYTLHRMKIFENNEEENESNEKNEEKNEVF